MKNVKQKSFLANAISPSIIRISYGRSSSISLAVSVALKGSWGEDGGREAEDD